MKKLLTTAAAAFGLLAAPLTASAQIERTADQTELCVTMMSGFPDDSAESRYVFFRLSQELASDITPELSSLMARHMAENETSRLPADWPMLDVIEDIADPVLRQAAPAQTVASMAHIAYFNALCGDFVKGQTDSLVAFDPALADADIIIREDALFLRQILAEALDRLGSSGTAAVDAYTASIVAERDDIEYTGFESEVGDLEALYMGDLDSRLATSNDMINSEMDTQALKDAVTLSNDMNEAARERTQQERVYSLIRILGNSL